MRVQFYKNFAIKIALASVVFCALVQTVTTRASANPTTVKLNTNQPNTLSIQVQTSDGKPTTNACVVCFSNETNVLLKSTIIEGGDQRLLTDSQGHFNLKWNGKNMGLMIANNYGFCLAQSRDMTNRPILVVQPWGRIEGVRIDHDIPLSNQRLSLDIIGRCVDLPIRSSIDMENQTSTDSDGRFVFEHVPPVEVRLQDQQKWLGNSTNHAVVDCGLQEIDMEPGETKQVISRTSGRTVVGRIELDNQMSGIIDLKSLDGSFIGALTIDGVNLGRTTFVPAALDTADQRAKWYRDWDNNTEAGRQHKLALEKIRPVMIRADGSFVSPMVEPGNYVLNGRLRYNGRFIALLNELHFVVPPSISNNFNTAIDVGTATLNPVIILSKGDTAPDFTTTAVDGHLIKLSDFRGNYVLLDFWATWCGPCVAEIPNLKATYDAFSADKRLIMISLSVDIDHAALLKFVKTHNIAWTQAFIDLNGGKDKIAESYGVYGIPSIFFIGPDGKLLLTNLRGPKMLSEVKSILSQK